MCKDHISIKKRMNIQRATRTFLALSVIMNLHDCTWHSNHTGLFFFQSPKAPNFDLISGSFHLLFSLPGRYISRLTQLNSYHWDLNANVTSSKKPSRTTLPQATTLSLYTSGFQTWTCIRFTWRASNTDCWVPFLRISNSIGLSGSW